MKFVEAECPNCGAQLYLNNNGRTAYCNQCGSRIVIDEAFECANYMSVAQKIKNGNLLLKLMEFDKAYEVFNEVTTIAPDRYEGWLGLFNAESMNEIVFEFEYVEDLSNAIKCIDDIYLRAKIQNIYDRYVQKNVNEDEQLLKIKINDNNNKIEELKNIARNKRKILGDLNEVRVMFNKANKRIKIVNRIGISWLILCAISLLINDWLVIILCGLLAVFAASFWGRCALKLNKSEILRQFKLFSFVVKLQRIQPNSSI